MTAWCKECNDYVETKQEDVGIGSYEFWGSRGTDTRWVVMCAICESPVYVDEDSTEEITVEDQRDDYDPGDFDEPNFDEDL